MATGRVASILDADGRRLPYRTLAAASPERHRLLYMHGIESHGAWFLPVAERLPAKGCTAWLLERRGSGIDREHPRGDAPSAGALLDDVGRFRDAVGDPPLVLAGLSWGGKLALAAALDRPARVRGVVLVAPGLKTKVDLSARDKAAALADLALRRERRFAIPIEPGMFTRRAAFVRYIRRDPLRVAAVTARFLRTSVALDARIARGLARLDVPVLLLLAERDRIVDNDGVRRLLERLPAGRLRTVEFAGAEHSLQFERPGGVARAILTFLNGLPP